MADHSPLSHDHEHSHNHDHEEFDPGTLYTQKWVQEGVLAIQGMLRDNLEWLGLNAERELRILDYGCGHGSVTLGIIDQLPKASFGGMDSHPKQVQRYNDEAEKLLGSGKERMSAIRGDLNDPPAEANSDEWFNFDIAIMSMALHHVPDPTSMLTALRKRLKPGGTLVIVEWCANRDSGKMETTVGKQEIWAGFTQAAMSRLLEDAGFKSDAINIRVPGARFFVPKEIHPLGGPEGNALMLAKARL